MFTNWLRLVLGDISLVIRQAIVEDKQRGLGDVSADFADNVLDRLAELVNGDARMSLNYLELLYDAGWDGDEASGGVAVVSWSGEARKVARFDNKGDIWYDFNLCRSHKSIRGSNPDAAFRHWSARMVQQVVTRLYIVRRLLAIASGVATDPHAMQVAMSAGFAARIGPAEGGVRLRRQLSIWRVRQRVTLFTRQGASR